MLLVDGRAALTRANARDFAIPITTGFMGERDSNPRCPFEHKGFQDRRFQPLTHPSAEWELHLFHQFTANSFDGAFCRSCTLVAH